MGKKVKFTRGGGLLEGLAARFRAMKANSLIPKNLRIGKILDIGCGSYPYFLLNTKFSEKVGIDPSLNSVKTEYDNLQLIKESVEKGKLRFKDQTFEAITMLAVFEHIEFEKLTYVLSEIKRVLKKDGSLVITTPAPWSDKILHFMAIFGLISKEEIHEHKHHYNKGYIEKTLKEAGFRNVRSGYFELGVNMWFTGIR